MSRTLVALALVSVFALPRAEAEVVVLKSGGQVEGELLNTSRKSDEPVELRTPLGVKLSFDAQQVQRVIIKSDAEKQYEQLAPKTPDTVAAQWDLAEWCRQAGLTELRHRHLEAVLRLNPNHEDARGALGFQKFDGQWLKPEDWMRARGYVRYQGSWRLKQEVEVDVRARQQELADKQWRQKIKMWKEQLGNSRRSAEAWANLQGIRDPFAAPALLDVFKDSSESRDLRLLALDLLLKMPGDYVGGVLVNLGLNDPDGNIRDRCLELLKERRSGEAVAVYAKLLKDKNNSMVNRAALCLERLEDTEATLPLIEALVTTHTYWVSQGGGPGSIGASFGKNDPGSAPGGPLGGMGMGGKPKPVKRDHNNETVLAALTRLHPGVNHRFDEDKWRQWYADTFTTSKVNLRRD